MLPRAEKELNALIEGGQLGRIEGFDVEGLGCVPAGGGC